MAGASNTRGWNWRTASLGKLFSAGPFEWSLGIRGADAAAFFEPEDPSGRLLAERRDHLATRPDLYLGATSQGGALVQAAWDLARGWGHSATHPPQRGLIQWGRRWEPDLLLVEGRHWTLAAACVCFPSSWDLRQTLGESVAAIHCRVPRLNAHVGSKVERFLRSLNTDKGFARLNWGLARTSERNAHPELNRPRLDQNVGIEQLFLRIERQLFIGIEGGVLMGIRIETLPLAELAEDRALWRLVIEKIRVMPTDVAAYKGLKAAQSAIVREMEAYVGPGPIHGLRA